VPLLRESALIGIIALARKRLTLQRSARSKLVETFADQAVTQ